MQASLRSLRLRWQASRRMVVGWSPRILRDGAFAPPQVRRRWFGAKTPREKVAKEDVEE
jgi:hypothetical protein